MSEFDNDNLDLFSKYELGMRRYATRTSEAIECQHKDSGEKGLVWLLRSPLADAKSEQLFKARLENLLSLKLSLPEVKTFGPVVPAYGIWARHVEGLKLINITFKLSGNDQRPALVCEDGKNITLKGWNIPETKNAESVIRLEQVNGALISETKLNGVARNFVQTEKECRDIKILDHL